jgi:hypothetical protein
LKFVDPPSITPTPTPSIGATIDPCLIVTDENGNELMYENGVLVAFDNDLYQYNCPTPTPTPTPTQTITPSVTNTVTPTPTSTPVSTPDVTNTPTMTSSPSVALAGVNAGTYYIYGPEGGSITAPTSNGNLLFDNNGFISFSPDNVQVLLMHPTDLNGINYLSTYTNLKISGGTISFTQNGVTSSYYLTGNAVWSATSTVVEIYQHAPGSILQQYQTAGVSFNTTNPITITINVGALNPNSGSTPTPTPDVTSTPSVTPTMTITPTTSLVSATPTPTPTPTLGYRGPGWNFYYSSEGTLNVGPPVANGNAIFINSSNQEVFDPNFSNGTQRLFFDNKDNNGTDYSTQFSNLQTNGGTITVTQGSNSAKFYASGSGIFQYVPPSGPNNGYLFINSGNGVTQTQTCSKFNGTDPITLTFS